jgi:hypothetical protein
MTTATFDLHTLIDEARRRARRRHLAYAAALALLAAAGIWAALTFAGGGGATAAPPAPPGYHLVRARGDVRHALLAGSFWSGQRAEVWLDPRAGLLREQGRSPSGRVAETIRCVPRCTDWVPLLADYWPLDTTKFVQRPGRGSFHGRRVIWIGKVENTFAPAWGNGEWIALDARTHDALGERTFDTTDKREGRILGETWVVKRFPDIAASRFWFPVANKLDVTLIRLQPTPLDIPGREPPRDLRHARLVVVGRLAGATLFAIPARDGFRRIVAVGKDGTFDGAHRIADPDALRAGLVQLGHGSLFTSRVYLVVAGSTLARRDTKVFVAYADGSRERIRLRLFGNPVTPAAFHYYVIPPLEQARGRHATSLQVVRGSRVVAHQFLPFGYQEPKQPGPRELQRALQLLGS